MDEDEELRAMWDGSTEWWLVEDHHDEAVVIVDLSGQPSLGELRALRKLLPEYGEVSPVELKRCLSGLRELQLGPWSNERARGVVEGALRLGLRAASHDISRSGYLAVTRRGEELFASIIEDEELAQRVYARVLRVGVPVIRDIRELLPPEAEARQPETS